LPVKWSSYTPSVKNMCRNEDQNNMTGQKSEPCKKSVCQGGSPFLKKDCRHPMTGQGGDATIRGQGARSAGFFVTSPPVTFGEQRVLLVVFARLLSRDWSAIFIRQHLPSRESARERERGIGVDICCCGALQHYAMLIHSTHTHSECTWARGTTAWHQKRERREPRSPLNRSHNHLYDFIFRLLCVCTLI